jgi:hypothetical protein
VLFRSRFSSSSGTWPRPKPGSEPEEELKRTCPLVATKAPGLTNFSPKKSPGEIPSPGLIPATLQQPSSGLTLAGGLAGRRPIIGRRLIIALLRRLVRTLLLRLRRIILLLRLLRLPVGCSSYAAPGRAEQTADSRSPPGIPVIDGGPEAGPQSRTQARAGVQAGILSRRGASRKQTQTQQSYQYPLLAQAQAPKAFSWLHDSSLPKGLIGAFKYLEPRRGEMLRLLSLGKKK